jgi:hypothetical protein
MGRLIYGARGMHLEMQDRLLAHVQAVVITKLRRDEPFAFTWLEPASAGSGRRTIWLHQYLEIAFEYQGSRPVELDRAMVEDMLNRANSNAGLDIADHAHNPPTGSHVTPVA